MATEDLRLGVDPRPAVAGFKTFQDAAENVVKAVYTLEQVLGKVGISISGVAKAVDTAAGDFGKTGTAAQEAGAAIDKAGETAVGAGEKIGEAGERAVSSWSKLRNFDWAGIGRTLSVSVTAPLGALAASAVAASESVNSSMQTIRRATGATGDELASLESSFRSLAGTVPNSFQEVAAALGDINTRVGATGQQLESLTRKMLAFARVNNEDVATSTRNVGTLMNALELEAKDLPLILDQITLAAQKTGIGANDLARGLIDAGLNFQELGFSTERAIALFAQFELVGARPTDVISSLNIALTNLARAGFTDANAAFDELLRQIRDAPSIMQATIIAADAFGAKVGAKLAEEIRGGTFEVDGFVEALNNAAGTIQNTDKESQTFAERMTSLRQQVGLAIEPIGVSLVGAFNELQPAMDRTIGLIGDMARGFGELPDVIQVATYGILSFASALGPLMFAIGGLSQALVLLGPTLKGVAAIAATFFGVSIGTGALLAVGALTVAIGLAALALRNWGKEAREAAAEAENTARAMNEAAAAFQTMSRQGVEASVSQYAQGLVDINEQIERQTAILSQAEATVRQSLGRAGGEALDKAKADLAVLVQRREQLEELYRASGAALQGMADAEEDQVETVTTQLAIRREISREIQSQSVQVVAIRDNLSGLLQIESSLTKQLQDRTMLLTDRVRLEKELRTVQGEINRVFATQLGTYREIKAEHASLSRFKKEELDALVRGLELNILTADELKEIYIIEEGINKLLQNGVASLEDRIKLENLRVRIAQNLGEAGANAAAKTRDAWSQVFSFLSAQVGGLIGQMAQIGQSVLSGNVLGAGLGVAGAVIGQLGIGGGAQAEAAQAQERYNQALQQFISMGQQLTSYESRFGALQAALVAAFEALMAMTRVKFGRGFDPTALSVAEWEKALAMLGKKAPAAVRAFYEEGLRLAKIMEENTQELRDRIALEISATEKDLQVRLLRAQGMDREAQAMQEAIQFERERQELLDKYGDEAAVLISLIDGIERVTRARREEADAARSAQLFSDFVAEIAYLKAVLSDDKLGQFTIRIQQDVERRMQALRKLFEDGIITAEQFAEAQEVIIRWAAKSVNDYSASLRDNADAARNAEAATRSNTRALWESAMAAQFQAQVEMANLQLRLLRAQGMDYEAARLSAHIELQKAVNDGRSAEYIRMLQQVQAYELATQAQRKATQAAKETTKAIQDTSRILNAPSGFRNALLRWRIAGGTATNPLGGTQTGFLASAPGTTGGSAQTIVINIADISLPNVSNAQQFLDEIVTEANRYARAGGGNVFQDLSEA
jgi:TP901 family phage tail tape measure protein